MKCLTGAACALLMLSAPGFCSIIYNVASDFSAASNPNGVWTYGYETALGGSLTPFSSSGNSGGIDYWNNALTDMAVGHNGTAGPAGWCGSCSVPAGDAILGPGNNGDFAVFRFTAPATGAYDIEASFFGADFTGPTSSDVHVQLNGSSLFDDLVNGYGAGSTTSYSGLESLVLGDTVDFVVGWGADASYNYDSTGLTATIAPTAVPEPATFALMFGALLALVGLRRRAARVKV